MNLKKKTWSKYWLVSAMSSAIHCNILLPWSPFQTRSRYLNSSSYCTMPMFKGTGRSDNTLVSFSFSRFSNQGVKCLSFVRLALKLVQKGLCSTCQSILRMALMAMMRCGSRNLIFWLSALFFFVYLSLWARNVLFKNLSNDLFVGIQEGTARLRRFALRWNLK